MKPIVLRSTHALLPASSLVSLPMKQHRTLLRNQSRQRSVDDCETLTHNSSSMIDQSEKAVGRPRGKIWIDTDVGFDDLVAIGCCFGCSGEHVAGISTVGGGMTCDPSTGVAILNGLFRDSIKTQNDQERKFPIVKGENGRTRQNHSDSEFSWLEKSRQQMTAFCSLEEIYLPPHNDEPGTDCESEDEATAALTSLARCDEERIGGSEISEGHHETEMIDLFCLGPLTNLSRWLEKIPGAISKRINSVWILGGNIPIRLSSTSTGIGSHACSPEFNFGRDPEAVKTVLFHPALERTTINIVPQEVCDRRAFENSFSPQQSVDGRTSPIKTEETRLSAETIIGNWLQDSPYSGPQKQNSNTPTVRSLLPSWMVRLIETRSYSIYGDSICVFVRESEYNNRRRYHSEGGVVDEKKPRIRWEAYSTGTEGATKHHPILTVDSCGRLIVREEIIQTTSGGKGEAPDSLGSMDPVGNIRIAHDVELGPVYLNWLTDSLIGQRHFSSSMS